MNAEIQSFLRELTDSTRNGHLRWGCSSIVDEYKLEMRAGVLMIAYNSNTDRKLTLHLFRGLGNDQILCEAQPSELDYGLLSELYSCARNSLSVTINELRAEIGVRMQK